MTVSAVRQLSTSTIRPLRKLEQAPPQRCELTPWDVSLLFLRYNQRGLLFHKPHPSDGQDEKPITIIIDRLKHSLSHVLAHFSPLAGRLVFGNNASSSSSSHVFIDCNDAGAEFIHAVADIGVAHVLTTIDVHPIVESFFPLNGAVNCDGISLPLFAVQLTELTDGFFVGCSFNHAVADGTSFWHFLSSWSEICRINISRENEPLVNISRPPVVQRWFPSGKLSPVSLPFSNPHEFIETVSRPLLRDRFFHFTPKSIARLKAKANEEGKTNKISAFQALSAHMWRSVTRARNLPADEIISCGFSIDNRSRLEPPLSRDYFGNCVQGKRATVRAGELLAHDLAWAAWLVYRTVVEHNDAVVRSTYDAWAKAPFFIYLSKMDNVSVVIGGSPRFDVYGVDFGWGRPVSVRSGGENKLDGKISLFPGREGGGSVDLELCLAPAVMCALESDDEFMDTVSSPPRIL
ncbi:uncharacterized acetyltransferase At3g50280-like [Magnolia sinica]|uniref:uncharacterized acetyltransferase At3g50280-like n=1 Tax=Magnolia sinica TaxID=86752 RepID=UPI002658079F|nr:uncharacterized acetyltransferase At3g50280-like [Magnolia sinica]